MRRPVSATVVVVLACIQATALILQFPVISRIGYSAVIVAVEFVYLLFVPGGLMLLLLGMEETHKWKLLVFTVGASLGFEMLMGAALSVTLPLLGVARPLQPLVIGVVFIGSTLCMTAGLLLRRGIGKRVPAGPLPKLDAYSKLSIMLPVLATLGAALENSGGGNAVLLALIALIGFLAASMALWPPKSEDTFPFTILMIALSLLLHTALVSSEFVGWDIHVEYYFYQLTMNSGFWNPTLPSTVNSMLSITVLPSSFSAMSGLDGVLLFKILYPIIFCFVPLGLYEFYLNFLNRRGSFISVFFVMAFYVFFKEMTQLARQEVAELFLVLLLLVLFEKMRKPLSRGILMLLFAVSIVVSHYGLGVVLMFLLPAIWAYAGVRGKRFHGETARPVMTWSFVAIFVALALGWYIYLGNSAVIVDVAHVGQRIVTTTVSDFLDPAMRDPATLAPISSSVFGLSLWRKFSWVLNVVSILSIFVGYVLVSRSVGRRDGGYDRRYHAIATAAMGLLVLAVGLPALAPAFNMSRIYHISLLLLAPLFTLGCALMVGWIPSLLRVITRVRRLRLSEEGARKAAVVIVAVPFFLFNTGFVYAVAGDVPTSYALGTTSGDPVFTAGDARSVSWLSEHRGADVGPLYGDEFGRLLLFERFAPSDVRVFSNTTNWTPAGSCVFLSHHNVVANVVVVHSQGEWVYANLPRSTFASSVLSADDTVYANGQAEIAC